MTDYTAVLEVYSLDDLLELNDITTEEALQFLVESKVLCLPNIKALDFD